MAQTLRSLPLSTGASQPSPVRGTRQSARRNPLWVAVHMPELALEALAIPDTTPAVVVEPRNGQHRVIAANPRALTRGIAPGLKLSAALALSPHTDRFEPVPGSRAPRAHLIGSMGSTHHAGGEPGASSCPVVGDSRESQTVGRHRSDQAGAQRGAATPASDGPSVHRAHGARRTVAGAPSTARRTVSRGIDGTFEWPAAGGHGLAGQHPTALEQDGRQDHR